MVDIEAFIQPLGAQTVFTAGGDPASRGGFKVPENRHVEKTKP